ncbi:MAG: hypothetical protein KF781_00835 [Chitinophagaceae bacterium]|nr:hypothetical protein [Chitinophagaceae bacterium]MCW5905280.1 hypothetical protein [Chitinophagaceae bacterium]
MLPFFEELVKFKKFNFDEFDAETIYDYCVLEYEFYFWQYFGNYKELKESLDLLKNYVYTDGGFKTDFQLGKQDELVYYLGIIAKDFLDKRYQPHFYQEFTQGGYYGYDEKPFKKYLKHKNYSLSVFAR